MPKPKKAISANELNKATEYNAFALNIQINSLVIAAFKLINKIKYVMFGKKYGIFDNWRIASKQLNINKPNANKRQ